MDVALKEIPVNVSDVNGCVVVPVNIEIDNALGKGENLYFTEILSKITIRNKNQKRTENGSRDILVPLDNSQAL